MATPFSVENNIESLIEEDHFIGESKEEALLINIPWVQHDIVLDKYYNKLYKKVLFINRPDYDGALEHSLDLMDKNKNFSFLSFVLKNHCDHNEILFKMIKSGHYNRYMATELAKTEHLHSLRGNTLSRLYESVTLSFDEYYKMFLDKETPEEGTEQSLTEEIKNKIQTIMEWIITESFYKKYVGEYIEKIKNHKKVDYLNDFNQHSEEVASRHGTVHKQDVPTLVCTSGLFKEHDYNKRNGYTYTAHHYTDHHTDHHYTDHHHTDQTNRRDTHAQADHSQNNGALTNRAKCNNEQSNNEQFNPTQSNETCMAVKISLNEIRQIYTQFNQTRHSLLLSSYECYSNINMPNTLKLIKEKLCCFFLETGDDYQLQRLDPVIYKKLSDKKENMNEMLYTPIGKWLNYQRNKRNTGEYELL